MSSYPLNVLGIGFHLPPALALHSCLKEPRLSPFLNQPLTPGWLCLTGLFSWQHRFRSATQQRHQGLQDWVAKRGFLGLGASPGNFQSQVSIGLTTLAFISPQMVQGVVEAHVRLDGQHG